MGSYLPQNRKIDRMVRGYPLWNVNRVRLGLVKKPVTVYYGKEAHLQLKILAAEADTTIQELHKEALNDLFVKHDKPPIA